MGPELVRVQDQFKITLLSKDTVLNLAGGVKADPRRTS